MIYYMTKTETEQWEKDRDVRQPSNIATDRKKCRSLIKDIAFDRGYSSISDDSCSHVCDI